MKIIAKNKSDNVKAALLEDIMNKYIDSNPEFLKDLRELAVKIVVFNAKWGTDFLTNK